MHGYVNATYCRLICQFFVLYGVYVSFLPKTHKPRSFMFGVLIRWCPHRKNMLVRCLVVWFHVLVLSITPNRCTVYSYRCLSGMFKLRSIERILHIFLQWTKIERKLEADIIFGNA